MRLELALLLLLMACPSTSSPPPESSGTVAVRGCHRDVQGDLQTIGKHLDKGRVEDARLYVEALAECREALARPRYFDLAGRVAESRGDLNGAWRAAKSALALAVASSDTEAAKRWAVQLARFESDYVWIQVDASEPDRPPIRYAGAVIDDPTMRQLEDVAQGKTVWSRSGTQGFWVFPGRYKVGAAVQTLQAGQVLMLSARSPGGAP